MTGRLGWVAAGGAVLLLAVFGASRWDRGQGESSPAAPVAPPTPGPGPLVAEGREGAEAYVAVVLAGHLVDVYPRREGLLREVHVALGQRVEQDQPLATLEAREAEREVRIAQARLRSLEAELARAEVERQAASERRARAEKVGASLSAQEVAEAGHAERAAAAQVEVARARVLEQRERLAQLQDALADTQVRAPFAGTVSLRLVEPGAPLTPRTAIVRLASDVPPRLRFALPAGALSRVGPGTRLRVELPGQPEGLQARVTHLATELDAASQHLMAEAELLPPSGAAPTPPAGLVGRVRLASPARPLARPAP